MEHAAAAPAQPNRPTIAPRAICIARGLRRTGRVGDLRAAFSGHGDDDGDERWIVMPARGDEFYFISRDGKELRRGMDWLSSEPLQAGFLAAMARAGGMIDPGVAPTRS
jgi:hypothetical protein